MRVTHFRDTSIEPTRIACGARQHGAGIIFTARDPHAVTCARCKATAAYRAALLPAAWNAPKSICECGHTGDGPRSDHAARFAEGHGRCTVTGCGCPQFTWARFTETYICANPGAFRATP